MPACRAWAHQGRQPGYCAEGIPSGDAGYCAEGIPSGDAGCRAEGIPSGDAGSVFCF
jgi:hypothetical protein